MKNYAFLLLTIFFFAISFETFGQEVDVVGKVVSNKKSILISGSEQVFLRVKLNGIDTYIPLAANKSLSQMKGKIVRVKGRFKIFEEMIGERVQFSEKLKIKSIKLMKLSDLRISKSLPELTAKNKSQKNIDDFTASNISLGDAATSGFIGGATLLLANSMGAPSTVEGKAQKSINVILLWTAIGALFFEEAIDTFSFENASWNFKPYNNTIDPHHP